MKENIEIKKDKTNLLFKIAICLTFVLAVFLGIQGIGYTSVKATNNQRMYLSDIPYDEENSKAASGHLIKLDKNDSDKLITLKVNDKPEVFLKGVTAWASSQVVYNISDYDFDYFTAYVGVDIGEQSNYFNTGVKFYIYVSNDGKNWEKETETGVLYGWSEAQPIKVNIKGVKYLKLEASSNSKDWWAEWYDEAIYADAKLIKDGYVEDKESEVDFIKTLEEYDKELKNYDVDDMTSEHELTLLQRELVRRADYDILQAVARYDEDNEIALRWLMSDVDNLRLYVLGGEPDGNYVSSIQALAKLYKKHKADLERTDKTKYGTVYGELYKKMMITISLTHSAQVALWMDTTSPENQSDPVTRYEIFKDLHANDKFVVSKNQDHTPWFESLKVEEMRFVMNNIIDDEEIVWLNEYTQKYINDHPNEEEKYLQPHPYMKYLDPDYSRPEFHDESKKEEWDDKYDFLRYGVTFRPGVNKLWMNIEGGAVCGGISKIGSNIRGVHGTPSSVISQPGHAALIYYRKDKDGNGYWTIDNDVSGWALSGKTEKLSVRMPLGWGSDSYAEGYCATYIVLAQEALNHYESYEEAEEIIMTADIYKDNPEKQEEIYRKALEVEPINIDAWYGLINLYKADENTSEEKYYELAEDICENLKCFPLPMYQLSNLIKPMLKSTEYSFKFTVLQINTLTEGTTWEDNTKVYQPSITQTVAKYLLGQMDKDLATFSFDGEDAGKIVLSSNYDDSGIHWDYSIDGKQTWIDVTYTPEEEHKETLTDEQLSKINAEDDIYVHIYGTSYEDENNIFKIDIQDQKKLADLYNNDLENRIVGVNEHTEWRYTDEDEWISYEDESPDLTGDKTIQVRQSATGTMLASEITTYTFTADDQPETRKYVPVAHLSIAGVSSETTGGNKGEAVNVIDGNYNTRWHSAWNGSDQERYIIIKVDRKIELSALDYVPAGGGNGKILEGQILGSIDGEEYTEIGTVKWDNNEETKTIEFEDKPTVQYIKIIGTKTSSAGGGSFMTGRMFNIYQDLTKNPHPTAGIGYNTQKLTNQNVIARLVNPSTDITITNHDSDVYVFEENGEFTFEFYDNKTKKEGTATAIVDWIDKTAPTATIEYHSGSGIDSEVTAEITPSEEVTVLNNKDGKEGYTYTFDQNGEFTFKLQDKAGNIGEVTASVNWIGTGMGNPNSQNNTGIPGSPEEVKTEKYKVEEGYISQILPKTTVKEFKENVEIEGEQDIVFVDSRGNVLTDDSLITTDTTMKLADNSQFTLEVTGDIDGDGKITVNDLARLKLHLIKVEQLSKTKANAADFDKNEECGIGDMADMKLILIGLKKVK